MSWGDFFLIYGSLAVTIAICRHAPMLLLKGRELSPRVSDALSLIPVAAFAALVANDLLIPGLLADGLWPGLLPLAASAIVCVVALRTRSLVASAIVGVAAYALLSMI